MFAFFDEGVVSAAAQAASSKAVVHQNVPSFFMKMRNYPNCKVELSTNGKRRRPIRIFHQSPFLMCWEHWSIVVDGGKSMSPKKE